MNRISVTGKQHLTQHWETFRSKGQIISRKLCLQLVSDFNKDCQRVLRPSHSLQRCHNLYIQIYSFSYRLNLVHSKTDTCTFFQLRPASSSAKMTLLSFIFSCLPLRLDCRGDERLKDEERERGRRKETALDRKSVTKASHWFWDGELMKPGPDMTVQCQTGKSYAGRRALAAISLQIVCVSGWQKKKQGKLKRHSFKKEKEANLALLRLWTSLSLLLALFTHCCSEPVLISHKWS